MTDTNDNNVDDPVKSFLAQQSEMMKSVLSDENGDAPAADAPPGSPEAAPGSPQELTRTPSSISKSELDAVAEAEQMTKMMQETLLAISPTSGNVNMSADFGVANYEEDGTLDDVILLDRDEETGAAKSAAGYGGESGGGAGNGHSGTSGGGGGEPMKKEQSWFAKNKIIVVIVALLVIIGAVGGALAATMGGGGGNDGGSSGSGSLATDGTNTGSTDRDVVTTSSPTAAPTVQAPPTPSPTISPQPTLTKQPSPAPTPCVPCSNTRANNMIVNNLYCDTYSRIFTRRCGNEGSWWIDAPEPYCQYSCWEQGVGYEGYPCCPIEDLETYEPPAVEKEEGCIECTNERTEFMIENRRLCDSWSYVLDTQCNNEGSFWNTLEDPPCQYECWRWGKPYDNYQNCCKKDPEPFFGLEARAPDMTEVVEVASDAPEEGAVAEPVVEEEETP